MFLYRFEVRSDDGSNSAVVVLHENEEKAFRSAESQMEGQFLPPKKIAEIAIVEKKPAGVGRGYVIDI
ncbi:DUF3906 family protein [Aneurinibacillus tyrosinisolvens]|uniref:DUF3906 family protein n=1 Tax=Aneurinibacillus tyrosinisolvens TaxID=1443435 RepID=UPI00063F874F|nr:DUF3906 family protein [Aneurinibacillus tyrosinisolvens]